MTHWTRTKFRRDPITGLDWHDHCKFGHCHFRAHTRTKLEARRIAHNHDAFHTAVWSA